MDDNSRHDDPAVQSLIDDGWLGAWDRPLKATDLERAVALVRQADLHAAGIPLQTEWSAGITYLDGTVKHRPAGDGEHAEHAALIADSIATHIASLNEPRKANGVQSTAVMSREVRMLPDGTRVIGPWRHVRDGKPLEG